jgi:hypothetical protein
LFPLYVDLRNHQFTELESQDFQAALDAAMNDVDDLLSRVGFSTAKEAEDEEAKRKERREQARKVWEAVAVKLPVKRKRLAITGGAMLATLDGLTLDKAKDFFQKFKELSAAYTYHLDVASIFSDESAL